MTIFHSVAELRAALAVSDAVDAYLLPGTHTLHRPLLLHGKTLSLRSNGSAELDAAGNSRHFIVQEGGKLDLDGVRLGAGDGGLRAS